VASILVEIGSEGRLREESAEYARQTLVTTLHRLNMIPATGQLNSVTRHTVAQAAKTGEFLHAPTGGFLRHFVDVGQVVSSGQDLGELVDPFGRQLAGITAPHAGLVAEMRTIPACRVGDWTYAVLPVLGTISPSAGLEALEELR
jgi:predicted deacylase